MTIFWPHLPKTGVLAFSRTIQPFFDNIKSDKDDAVIMIMEIYKK